MAQPVPPPVSQTQQDTQAQLTQAAQANVQAFLSGALHEQSHPPQPQEEEDLAPHDVGYSGIGNKLSKMVDTFKNTVSAVKSHLSSDSDGAASNEAHREFIDRLFERVCGINPNAADPSTAETAALFIWSVLARHDDTLHKMWDSDKGIDMEARLLNMSPTQLAALRDAVDVLSEGLGFLPLVLATGNRSFYDGLVSILQQEPAPRYLPLKIFSDIDDTYLAGWLDTPVGEVYEGVRELYSALLHYHNPPEVIDSQVQLIFLSARPASQQSRSIGDLRRKGAGFPVPGRFVMLYGRLLSDVVAAVDTHSMGHEKVKMFKLYRGLYPHFLYYFFGDTGQGDADTGEEMFWLPDPKDRPIAVYLHEVRPESQVRTRKIGGNFIYHNTYAEARTRTVHYGYLPNFYQAPQPAAPQQAAPAAQP